MTESPTVEEILEMREAMKASHSLVVPMSPEFYEFLVSQVR